MIPRLTKQPVRTLNVPKLSGGVNETDQEILDNQLQAAENVMFSGGLLHARPGYKCSAYSRQNIAIAAPHGVSIDDITTASVLEAGSKALVYFGNKYHLNGTGATPTYQSMIYGTLFDDSGHVDDADIRITGGGKDYKNPLAAHGNNEFYLYGAEAAKKDTPGNTEETPDPYIPLALAYGLPTTDKKGIANGYMIDNYNQLTKKYLCKYTSNGIGIYYPMPLPFGAVTATYTYVSGGSTVTYSTTLTATQTSKINASCGITLNADRKLNVLWFTYPSGLQIFPDIGVRGNIEFECTGTTVKTEFTPSEMTISRWFGGDRSGLNGGTRLFMAGSEEHKNLLIWSGLNNPLYFPDHNYAYIGDSTEKITGLAQMSNVLVVFKERSIYMIDYTQGSYSADSVTEYEINGVQAAEAVFPVTPLAEGIGCDYATTIRLCNNRLVWYYKGKVYALFGVNQYSEKNIVCLSRNINLPETVEYDPSSAEHKGHYLLHIDGTIYVLNYETAGFSSYTYYASEENACRNLMWYKWDYNGLNAAYAGLPMPQNITSGNVRLLNIEMNAFMCVTVRVPVAANDSHILLMYQITGDKDSIVSGYSYDDGTITETQTDPAFRVKTKAYDFGMPNNRKRIMRSVLRIKGSAAVISIMDDRSTSHNVVSSDDVKPAFIRMPGSCKNMALDISGTGIEIDGMSIEFTPEGECRT